MKTYTHIRFAAAIVVAMFLSACPAAYAKMTKALNDTASTGMNALDYVLQKPAGSRTFDPPKTGNKFFFSLGGSLSVYGNQPKNQFRPGFGGEFMFGDWVSPVHGWRVDLAAGSASRYASQPWRLYGSIGADYMMNFSSLLKGDNPNRRFNLIGTLGAEYRRTRDSGVWGNQLGFRAGLQAQVRLQSNLFLYVEPRLGFLTGSRYTGDDYRRLRPNFSLNIGLGYRLMSKEERLAASIPFLKTGDSHLFFGAGGGVWSFARRIKSDRHNLKPFASFYVGKYFTPTAGIRVKGEFGKIGENPEGQMRYLGVGAVDFLWNLTSALGGYNPDNVFDLTANFGIAWAYASNAYGRSYPGFEAGLQANFRVSPNWGIFVAPEARIFTGRCTRDLTNGGRDALVSLMLGLRYTIGDFKYFHPESYKEFVKADNSFLSFAIGGAKRWRASYGKGFNIQAAFGHRFTPVSSWRVSVDAEAFSYTPHFGKANIGADYMFSISTSMAGFNPRRVFDLSALVGAEIGAGKYTNGAQGFFGGRVGLHGAFRLNKALDLYIEPVLAGNTLIGSGSNGWTPEARIMLGLKYKLGTAPDTPAFTFAQSPLGFRQNFVGFSTGPSAFSQTFLSNRHLGGSFRIEAGHWFSRTSAARLSYTFDLVGGTKGRRRPNMHTFAADYMLNISSIMDANPGRRFHVIGIAGVGVGFSRDKGSKAGFMAEAGAQFRYNLPCDIDLHIEPIASFWANRTVPGFHSSSRFVGIGRLMAGLSYRF